MDDVKWTVEAVRKQSWAEVPVDCGEKYLSDVNWRWSGYHVHFNMQTPLQRFRVQCKPGVILPSMSIFKAIKRMKMDKQEKKNEHYLVGTFVVLIACV